jgi:hypothetical protein
VRVDVGGDRHGRVAEDLHYHAHGHTLGRQEGGAGVPQIVEADAADAGPCHGRIEAPSEVGRLDDGADAGREHQAVVGPSVTGELLIDELRSSTSDEGIDRGLGERDRPARAGGLGCADDHALPGPETLHGLAHSEFPDIEIHVGPAERQQLALPHPERAAGPCLAGASGTAEAVSGYRRVLPIARPMCGGYSAVTMLGHGVLHASTSVLRPVRFASIGRGSDGDAEDRTASGGP